MGQYEVLKAAIEAVIKQNGNNEITGDILQSVLLSMVNSLGAGYQFIGVATMSTIPGTPDQNVFYIASTPGTYSNFGGLIVDDGEVAVFKWNGSWTKENTGAAPANKVAEQGIAISKRDNVVFDIAKSTFDVSQFGFIEDIIIINGDPKQQYSLYQVSATRASIKKNGVIIADNSALIDTPDNWHFLKGQSGGVEIIYIKYNPANVPSLINTGANVAVIRSDKVVSATLMNPERARENAANVFSDLTNFGLSKNALSLLIDEIFIYGYTVSDNLQIRMAKYENGRFDFRIQQGADKIFTIDTDAPKAAYLLFNGDKYCFVRFNTAIIQSLNVSLGSDATYYFSDNVFKRDAHPFAFSMVCNHRKAYKVFYSGDILLSYPFSSLELLDKDAPVHIETEESGGVGRIVFDPVLGKYIYEHRKYASKYNPSLNLKISTALRENFSGTDLIRIRGKVYVSKGDSPYPGSTIPLTFYWMKEGKYPTAADVEQFHVYNPIPNETWTDFSVSGQIGDIGAWPYNSFRAGITISTQDQYANSQVDKVVAVSDLRIEIINAEFNATYNAIEIVDNSVVNPLPNLETNVGKIDEASIGQLAVSAFRSVCRMARVYFSKIKSLVAETEILYLNENFRTPTKGKSALSVEDGVLYFYDKNGNKKTINME